MSIISLSKIVTNHVPVDIIPCDCRQVIKFQVKRSNLWQNWAPTWSPTVVAWWPTVDQVQTINILADTSCNVWHKKKQLQISVNSVFRWTISQKHSARFDAHIHYNGKMLEISHVVLCKYKAELVSKTSNVLIAFLYGIKRKLIMPF